MRQRDEKILAVIFVVIAHALFLFSCYQASVIDQQRVLIRQMYKDCPASPSNPKEMP